MGMKAHIHTYEHQSTHQRTKEQRMSINNKYQASIKKCRKLLGKYTSKMKEAAQIRHEIALEAIKVREFAKLTVLADDLEIKYTTLMNWITEAEKPTRELEAKEGEDIDKPALKRTKKKINKGSTNKEVRDIYTNEKKKAPEDLQLEAYVQQMGAIEFFICNQAVLSMLNKDDLMLIEKRAIKIADKLLSFLVPVGPSEEIDLTENSVH